MAWTEQCKIDANNQIEHLKQNRGYSTRKACIELSDGSGIPVKTLQDWATYPNGRPQKEVSEKSDILNRYYPPVPEWMAEIWENHKENGKWPTKKMRLLHDLLPSDEGLEFLNKETWESVMRVRFFHFMLCCYYHGEDCSDRCPSLEGENESMHQFLKRYWGWPPSEDENE